MNKKAIAKIKLKMKIARGSLVEIPVSQPPPSVPEQGPRDISTMDHASGLSGMPTPSGQK